MAPLFMETIILLLLAFGAGLLVAWFIWARAPRDEF